jgi:hypothetical protein
MSLFKDIVESVLLENVQISKINDAITKTYEVKINYKSETDSASGERIIQPVAYGVSKSGNLILRAYQPFGDTQSSVPSWKLFSLSGIQKWKPLRDRTFDAPEGFNPNGDKTMATVYTIAKFNNTPGVTSKNTSTKSGPVTKTSITNNFKRNEEGNKNYSKPLDNLNKKPDIMINNNPQTATTTNGPVTKASVMKQEKNDNNQPEVVDDKNKNVNTQNNI